MMLKGAGLGLNAKACIHPNQIEVVNKVFSPSKENIEYSLRVLKAYEQAKKKERCF